MIAPHYRRPRSSLSPDEVERLVRMRDQGATWQAIGRTFRKQDGACKTIFDKAKANGAEAHAAKSYGPQMRPAAQA